MEIARRTFIQKTGMFAGAMMFLPATGQGRPASIPRVSLSDVDQAVLKFLGTYSPNYYLQGGCVLGKMNAAAVPFTYVIAEIVSLDTLESIGRVAASVAHTLAAI